MRKPRKRALFLLLISTLVLLAGVLFVSLFSHFQTRIVERYIRKAIDDFISKAEIGEISYDALKVSITPPSSVTLVNLAVRIREQEEPLLTANSVRIRFSLRQILKDDSKLDLNFDVRYPSITLHYLGDGRFSTDLLVEKLKEEEARVERVKTVRIALRDVDFTLILADGGQEEIDSRIKEASRRISGLLKSGLANTSKEYGIRWTGNLVRSAEEFSESVGSARTSKNVKTAFSGSVLYRAESNSLSGRISLREPLSADLRLKLSFPESEFTLRGETREFSLAQLPLTIPKSLELALKDGTFKVSNVEIRSGEDGLVPSFNLFASSIILPSALEQDIRVPRTTITRGVNGFELTSEVAYKSGRVNLFANSLAPLNLSLKFFRFPIEDFVESVRSFSAETIDGTASLSFPKGALSASMDTTAEVISYRGKPVLDTLKANVSLEGSVRFSLEGVRKGRRLLRLSGAGTLEKVNYDLVFALEYDDLNSSVGLFGGEAMYLHRLRGKAVGQLSVTPFALTGRLTGGEAQFRGITVNLSNASLAGTTSFLRFSVGKGKLVFPSLPVLLPYNEYLPASFEFSGDLVGNLVKGRWKLKPNLTAKARLRNVPITYSLNVFGTYPSMNVKGEVTGILEGTPLVSKAEGVLNPEGLESFELEGNYGPADILAFGAIPFKGELALGYEVRNLPLNVRTSFLSFPEPVSLVGRVDGELASPFAVMRLLIPEVVVEGVPSNFQGISIRDVSLPLTWEKRRFAVDQGSFYVNGSLFWIEGYAENSGVFLRASTSDFPAGSILSQLTGGRIEAWKGSGQFTASLSAQPSLSNPQSVSYRASYIQEGGGWMNEPIRRAVLSLSGSEREVRINRAELKLGSGLARAEGGLCLRDPYNCSLDLTFDAFPIGPIAGYLPATQTGDISGDLSGKISLAGDISEPLISGSGSIARASLLGTAFEVVRATFVQEKNGLDIKEFVAFNDDIYLSGSGFWGKNPEERLVNLEAPFVDLSLFSSLVPQSLRPIAGEVGASFTVVQTVEGAPKIVGTFQSAGAGVSVANVTFERAEGRLTYSNGSIQIPRVFLRIGSASLTLSGEIPVAGAEKPLNLVVEGDRLPAQSILALLPDAKVMSGGDVSLKLQVVGAPKAPVISGNAQVDLTDFRYQDEILFPAIFAELVLEDNRVVIPDARLYTVFSPSYTDAQNSFISVSGDLEVNFSRRTLQSTNLRVSLEKLQYGSFRRYFRGGLRGELNVNKRGSGPLMLTGNVVLRKGSEIRVSAPREVAPETYLAETLFNLSISAEEYCSLRYPAAALEVEFWGDLKVTGTIGAPIVVGELTAPKGSMVVYHHVVRLVEPARISFSPGAGLVPYVIGTAAVEIPGALSSTAFPSLSEVVPPLVVTTDALGTDLTIYFHFNNLLTEESLSAIKLSSSPALPQETIRSLLVGEMPGQVTRSSLESLVQTEALLFSSSRLSRFLEESLDFKRFELRTLSTREGTPIYLNVEKELTEEFTLRYLRTFFTTLDDRQEVALKYLIFKNPQYRASLELVFRKRAQLQEETVLNLEVERKF